MKTTSKILCALLVLTMVFAMFSVSASAEATVITATNGTAADITGIPANATVKYLSDAAAETKAYNQAHPELGQGAANKNAEWDGQTLWFFYGSEGPGINTCFNTPSGKCYVPGEDGTPVLASTVGKDDAKVYLGKDAIEYEKALGVNAGKDAADRAQVFLNNGSQYFYGVAGNNGANSTKGEVAVTFEVWGSNDTTPFDLTKTESFTKLATADVTGFQVAEFNVDISGYKVIWLNVKYNGNASGGRYGAWGNACFYTPAAAGGETPSTPTTPSTPPKTADSFTMTAVAALVVAGVSATALVVSKKKFF